MKKVKQRVYCMAVKGYIGCQELKERIGKILRQKEGEGFVDSAIKILISVVIGALLLAGLYALFKDTVLPTLVQKVKTMFDYNG